MAVSKNVSSFICAYPKSTIAILLCLAILLIYYQLVFRLKRAQLPVYSNHTGLFASWYDALDYVRESPWVLKRGYEKYSRHGLFFQLRTPARWVVVVPPRFIEEVRTAAPNQLSARIAANDVQQAKFTISPILEENKFHFSTIKTHLTPNLEIKINDLLEEIGMVFHQEIGIPTEWKAVTAASAAHRIATRTANRLLVGAPLCRNEEYLQMSMRYAVDMFQGADKLRSWPDFLKPLVARVVTRVAERKGVAQRHLLPYIKERLRLYDRYISEKQSFEDQPIDSLQWCIETAPSDLERDPERLMYRLLHLNVAAVHTTSVTFLNALYDLAFHQDIHDELRYEIVRVLQEDGWTSKGLNKMWKLDSFMLESQRRTPMASSQMTRAVVSDFTFSDGTRVPSGSFVLVPMHAMYLDEELYPNAAIFDAFRWSRKREQPGNENRFQFVSTSPGHINFGHGRDACPGRFFAAQEIKLLLAHVLLNYDLKLADPSGLPVPSWYDRSRLPNQTAQVLFRARQ